MSGYYGGRYDEDAIAEARMETAMDELERVGWRCSNGHLWDPGYHRATRSDPAYLEHDECPYCGAPPEDS